MDCLTEELEESKTDTIYDDYKFLTLEELKALSLTSLIGSNLLRAYMHGYFVDQRLYRKGIKYIMALTFIAFDRRGLSITQSKSVFNPF